MEFKFLICKEIQAYVQERMAQINIWIYRTKNDDLIEVCMK